MKRLVECVPNFSEGRDLAKVEAIVAAMREIPGVFVLDRESDPDHNRSVVTLAGEPEAIAEAALRGVGKAAELIDLTKHSGAHPRLGATDVLPFVPIEGVSIEDCIVLAKKAGREIWNRYKIPVYFYEAAAQRPDRTNLENIRKGQFEGLREEVLKNPDRSPDVGAPRLHLTAGAVVVGARKFLIAYNINLNTPDIEIAKRIAKSVRFSNGGLRYVKAMGVDLKARHIAEVSINLTDFEQTPIHRVFEMVKREAERYGVTIAGSEIVGLVPKRAIELTSDFYLQLENFSAAQVLENRMEAALGGASSEAPGRLAAMVLPFVEAVGQPTAAPGGGSVAALAGALGAALGQMVAGLSRKKKSQAAYIEPLSEAASEFQAAAKQLAESIDRDAGAFESVLAAYKLSQGTSEEQSRRDKAIEQALKGAAEAPLEVARKAAELFDRLGQLEPMASPSMLSDVQVGRLMAAAAVRGSVDNVIINVESLSDAAFAARMKSEAQALSARVMKDSASAAKR
ncbi:MAG TPA: glutamate formimidoyltransferase [Candidatus Acidoferrales bacterium]|jgi:glutamate formiminotransferase|nr:glutamate formimidoyltransferase [Candidatus Acidoferrales bacterium]